MKDGLPPFQRWRNRILALPIALQNSIFEEFLSLTETRVAAARAAGRLDVGVETILVDTARPVDDVVLRTDPGTGATSHLLTIERSEVHTSEIQSLMSISYAVFCLKTNKTRVKKVKVQEQRTIR